MRQGHVRITLMTTLGLLTALSMAVAEGPTIRVTSPEQGVEFGEGEPVTVRVVVSDGSEPVTEVGETYLKVTVLMPDGRTPVLVNLRDDGQLGDQHAGDGIWTGRFQPENAGMHTIEGARVYYEGRVWESTTPVSFSVQGGWPWWIAVAAIAALVVIVLAVRAIAQRGSESGAREASEDAVGVSAASGTGASQAGGEEEGLTTMPPEESWGEMEFVGGPREGEVVGLAGDAVIIGRASENDIVLEERFISRPHGTLRRSADGRVTYEDHSSAGTIVDGQQIRNATRDVRNGTRLGFVPGAENPHVVTVSLPDAAADEDEDEGATTLVPGLASEEDEETILPGTPGETAAGEQSGEVAEDSDVDGGQQGGWTSPADAPDDADDPDPSVVMGEEGQRAAAGVLEVTGGPSEGNRVQVTTRETTIGSGVGMDLHIIDDEVQEHHATIEYAGGEYSLRAVDGAPMTVEGEDVGELRLMPDACDIEMGQSVVRFEPRSESDDESDSS